MMIAPNFSNTDLPFPWKLHMMLEHAQQAGLDAVVSWMPSGKAFKVHNRDIFSKRILPQFFRHSNFKSFQRNLSVYQFTRIWTGPESGSYSHRFFLRDDRTLCQFIVRQSKPIKVHPKDDKLKLDAEMSEDSEPKTELITSIPGAKESPSPVARPKKAQTGEKNKKPSKRQRKGQKQGQKQPGRLHESSVAAGSVLCSPPIAHSKQEPSAALVIPNEIFEQNTDTIMWMYDSGFTSADLLDMLDVDKKKASNETSTTTTAELLDTKPYGVRPRWSPNSIDDICSLLRNVGEDDLNNMEMPGGDDLLDQLWKQTLGQGGGASIDFKNTRASRPTNKTPFFDNKMKAISVVPPRTPSTGAQVPKLAQEVATERKADDGLMLMDDDAMIFPQDQGTSNIPFLTEGDPFDDLPPGTAGEADLLGAMNSDEFAW
jgi:hypothetical protein